MGDVEPLVGVIGPLVGVIGPLVGVIGVQGLPGVAVDDLSRLSGDAGVVGEACRTGPKLADLWTTKFLKAL